MLFCTNALSSPNLQNNEIERFEITKFSFATDQNLDGIIDEVEDGELIQFWTKGKWSMHQLIKKLVEVLGNSDVTLCTWAITEEPLRVIHNMKTTGKIKHLIGLFEHKVKSRGSAFAFAEQFFDEVYLSKCHAKVTIIEGAEKSVSVFCSANLTKNRRIEAGTIFCHKKAAVNNRNYIINASTSTT